MFKPLNITKMKRKVIVDEQNNDATPDIVGNQKFLFVKINKGTLKEIKTAMQIQLDRTTNTQFFDPIGDKDQIETIKEAAEDIRKAYDIVSEGA